MKNLLLILVLSLFSIQCFAGGCPDGSEPVESISDDGTYFVYNCGGGIEQSSSPNPTNTNSNIKASYALHYRQSRAILPRTVCQCLHVSPQSLK